MNATPSIQYAIADSILGKVLVAQTDKGICSVLFADKEEALPTLLQQYYPHHHISYAEQALQPALQQLTLLIENPKTAVTLPLDMTGTDFQKTVWQALTTITPGQTLSYKQLAQKIGNPKAVRAVASACGANKLAVLIPCHRVIGSNGQLTGYRWGLHRKQQLLTLEQTVDS